MYSSIDPKYRAPAVMDYSTLAVMTSVAAGVLDQARLRHVIGLPSGDILLQFDIALDEAGPGHFDTWLLSAHPALFRFHPFLDAPPRRSVPSHIVDVASHHLSGARVDRIEITPFERIIIFHFTRRDYSGEETGLRLIAELMGKHSNIVLVDNRDIILASYKPVHAYQSRFREVRSGKIYQPPPPQDRIPPREFTQSEWTDFLNSAAERTPVGEHIAAAFRGVSPSWSETICLIAGVDPDTLCENITPEQSSRLRDVFVRTLERVERGLPVIEENPDDFARRVAIELTAKAARFHIERARSVLRSVIGRRRKKLDSLRSALEGDLDRSSAMSADEFRKQADLLLANLFQVVPGMTELDVNDWETGGVVKLKLDPHLSPQLQVEGLYRKYRKLKRTNEVARDRLRMVEAEVEELNAILEPLENARNDEELETVREGLVLHGLIPSAAGVEKPERKAQKKKGAARPGELIDISAHRYRSNDGFLILAGKGDRSNDALRRMSKPQDIWLHVRDIPGSHVYIVTGGREVPKTTLMEAAMIAVWNSRARESSNVPVDYTQAKYVTSIPGAGPGRVRFRREHTLRVTADEKRVEAMRLTAGDE
jgi:predicted ribosome quality control (RQC) complex YloA/Tae2 family protein